MALRLKLQTLSTLTLAVRYSVSQIHSQFSKGSTQITQQRPLTTTLLKVNKLKCNNNCNVSTFPQHRNINSNNSRMGMDTKYTFCRIKSRSPQQVTITRSMNQIVEEGVGTHKPSPFQKKILVWGKIYPSIEKVPDRVTRNQLKKAMDKFRIRVSIIMVAGTFVFAAMMALVGRKERQEGMSVTKSVLESRKQS